IRRKFRGWGFRSVVERLPRKHKALGSVPSS
ncbi:rCG27800, partial [Rattus norvegicus]